MPSFDYILDKSSAPLRWVARKETQALAIICMNPRTEGWSMMISSALHWPITAPLKGVCLGIFES